MNVVDASSPLQVDLQVVADDPDLPDGADWEAWVGAALAGAGRGASGIVTVRLVGEEESAALNASFRDKPGPTNVLSFTGPGEILNETTPGATAETELGDLVICLPVARREADEQGKTTIAHLAHLTVHGTLHLIGYDHQRQVDAERMENLEIRVLDGLGFADPYIIRERTNDNGHE